MTQENLSDDRGATAAAGASVETSIGPIAEATGPVQKSTSVDCGLVARQPAGGSVGRRRGAGGVVLGRPGSDEVIRFFDDDRFVCDRGVIHQRRGDTLVLVGRTVQESIEEEFPREVVITGARFFLVRTIAIVLRLIPVKLWTRAGYQDSWNRSLEEGIRKAAKAPGCLVPKRSITEFEFVERSEVEISPEPEMTVGEAIDAVYGNEMIVDRDDPRLVAKLKELGLTE